MGPKKDKRLTKKEKKLLQNEEKQELLEEKTKRTLKYLSTEFPGLKIDTDIVERVECMSTVSQLFREEKRQLSVQMLANIKEDIFNNYLLQEHCKVPTIQAKLHEQLRIMKKLKLVLEGDVTNKKKTDYVTANDILRDLHEISEMINADIKKELTRNQQIGDDGFFDFYHSRASTNDKNRDNAKETGDYEAKRCTGARPKEKKNEHLVRAETKQNERKLYIRQYLEHMSERASQAYSQTRHGSIWAVGPKKFIFTSFTYCSEFKFKIVLNLIKLIPNSIASLLTGIQSSIPITLLTKMISFHACHAEENALTSIVIKLQWLLETFTTNFKLKTCLKMSENEETINLVLVQSRTDCSIKNTQKTFCHLLDYIWDLLSELEETKVIIELACRVEFALRLEQEEPYMITADISKMKISQQEIDIIPSLQAELVEQLNESVELVFLNLKSYALKKLQEGKGQRVYFVEKYEFSSIHEIENIFSTVPFVSYA